MQAWLAVDAAGAAFKGLFKNERGTDTSIGG